MLEKAIQIAVEAHKGQTDKAGQPYILHLLRVMFGVETETEKICSVLHDVIEDTPIALVDLRAYGFSDEILTVLDLLTHKQGDSYEKYIEKIATNPVAVKVKKADLTDNMDLSRLHKITAKDRERVEKYYKAFERLSKCQKSNK